MKKNKLAVDITGGYCICLRNKTKLQNGIHPMGNFKIGRKYKYVKYIDRDIVLISEIGVSFQSPPNSDFLPNFIRKSIFDECFIDTIQLRNQKINEILL